jgi:chromate transporter
VPYSQWKAFFIFLKVGAVLFGSGYVLFAYLDGELIQNMGWLSESDLVEAIAIGQVTPGPVLSTATFIGYKMGGVTGALLATAGIFLPSFFYVWALNPFIKYMRTNAILKAFLSGVNAAAVAVMVAVTYKMFASIVTSWQPLLICLVSFGVYFYFKKLSPFYIILGGAALGYILSYI